MDDWRLQGQEEYLSKAVLYKIKFPEFWKNSYLKKNEFYQYVLKQALKHTELFPDTKDYLEGERIQHFWHEHCEFCWDKATTDTECEFYCTKDWYHWICKECFSDFKNKFGWSVTSFNALANLKYIYDRLSQYDLTLTNAFALDAGFSADFPILCGKRNGRTFHLYEDESLFVFSVEEPDKDYREHWHPYDVDTAIGDVIAFMEGTEQKP